MHYKRPTLHPSEVRNVVGRNLDPRRGTVPPTFGAFRGRTALGPRGRNLTMGDDSAYIVEPGARLFEENGHLVESLGAVGEVAPPLDRASVSTLMHVGHDGLGIDLGPDISGTARTIGWGAAAVWAYQKFHKKNEKAAKTAALVALGGWTVGLFT